MAKFVLSAFVDEVSSDLSKQVQTLKDLNLGYIDLRSVDGKYVKDFTDHEVEQIRKTLCLNGIQVACIGSQIGKSSIDSPSYKILADFARVVEIGKALGTNRIRIFGFLPPASISNNRYDEYVDQAIRHLERFIPLASHEDMIVLMENREKTVGDTVARCYRLIRALSGDHFRFLWNPADFVQVGERRVTDDAWDLLGRDLGYVHINDALLADGRMVPAGEGDGQVRQLLERLNAAGYEGFLALEPHLKGAGPDDGVPRPEKLASLITSLRKLMASLGITEERAL